MVLYPEEIEHKGEIIDMHPELSEAMRWLIILAVQIAVIAWLSR